MLVADVMTTDPVTVRIGTPVKEALALLAENRITALPVVTAAGTVRGVVSEADLIRELLPRDPRTREIPAPDDRMRPTRVDTVMSAHPVTVHEDCDLVEAVDLLTSTTVKSLPVVDRTGHLRGVLSRSDIVRVIARADQDIEHEVDALLRSSGVVDWLVEVHDGTVELLGPEHASDEVVARLLASTVSGVLDVTTRTETS